MTLRRIACGLAAFSTNPLSRGGFFAALTVIVAVAMTVTHIIQIGDVVLPSGLFKTLHVAFAIVIVCLAVLESGGRRYRIIALVAPAVALLAIASAVYIFIEYPELVSVRAIFADHLDIVFGSALVAAALFAAWVTWGWMIPTIAVVALLYGAFGYLLPGELLFHGGISFARLVAYSSIPFFQGILGGLTELSAGTIFAFLFFGATLQATGGVDFIIEFSRRIGGRSRAGPAQVAVISSGAMGMISGSTVANTASTGAITIPLMKRFGFKPEFAGAVEAAASMGGQITPPVMGLAAFLIVGLTGIPYAQVMIAAIVPAVVYYAFLMFAVHLKAEKMGLDSRTAPDTVANPLAHHGAAALAFRHGHLILGIALLVGLLFAQMPPGISALYGGLFILATDFLRRLFSTRPFAERLRDAGSMILVALEGAGRSGAQIGVILAVIGILVEILTVTGFAQKLSASMLALSDGSTLTLSLIVAGSCVVFGLGLPTPAAYLLVALFGAPALVESGVPLLAAHMFVFFFANVSAITPPVAVAALVAANIAKASFMGTALQSVRLGLPAYFLPFLFLAHPQLIGIDGSLLEQILFGVIALGGAIAINMAFEGYGFGTLSPWQRAALTVGALLLLLPGLWSSGAGAVVAFLVFLPRLLTRIRRTDGDPATPTN